MAGQVMPMKSQSREGRQYGIKLAFNVVPVPKARHSNLKIEKCVNAATRPSQGPTDRSILQDTHKKAGQ